MKSQKYNCQDCGKYFSTKFSFREHRNIHTGEFPFMCPKCQEAFSVVSEYIRHWADRHLTVNESEISALCSSKTYDENNHVISNVHSSDGNDHLPDKIPLAAEDTETAEKTDSHSDEHRRRSKKNYACSQCNLKFKSAKKCSEHKRKMHAFLCENCNNRYSSSEKLSKHVCFVLSDGEPFKCSCNQSFTKAAQFKIHIGSKPYSCCQCLMQFNKVTNLVRHIRTHTKQKPYICNECGRGFSQSTNLRNHASVHLGVKAVHCDECDFSCKTLSGLVKHKKKHKDGFVKHSNYIDKRKTSTEAITCPICNREFPFKRNMGMHMKIHTKMESLCQECGKVFDSKSKLTTHYKACHGVPSMCQTCGKTFASAVLLAAHEKIHVSGKTFSCTKCRKMFSIKNYLVQHMKTHSEGKQYSCTKCGKLFKVAVSLKYHSKICSAI